MVETIVSVMLIAVTATGVASLYGSTSVRTAKAKGSLKQIQLAEATLGRLKHDRTWSKTMITPGATTTICPGAQCPLNQTSTEDDPREDYGMSAGTMTLRGTFDVQATATAVDASADFLGAKDSDGQTVDYYRINVTVNPGTTTDTSKPYSITSTIDPLGRAEKGSVSIAFCEVGPQVDARNALNLTNPNDGTALECKTESHKIWKNNQCLIGRATDCKAWDASPAGPGVNYHYTQTQPLTSNVSFKLLSDDGTIKGPFSTNTGLWDSRVANVPLEPGAWRIVDPGTASAAGTPDFTEGAGFPSGLSKWESQSIPAGGFITVEAGQHSNAAQVFQHYGSYRLYLRSKDVSNPWNVTYVPGIPFNMGVKLIPAPLGRTALRQINSMSGVQYRDRWTPITTGQNFVDIDHQATGLHSMELLRYPAAQYAPYTYPDLMAVRPIAGVPTLYNPACAVTPTCPAGFPGFYVWVDPATSSNSLATISPGVYANKPTALMLTVRKCNPIVRQFLIDAYCTGYPTYPRCWAEAKLNPADPDWKLAKRYLEPCQNDSPILPGVNLGTGGG